MDEVTQGESESEQRRGRWMESQEMATFKGWLKKKWNEQEGEKQKKSRE